MINREREERGEERRGQTGVSRGQGEGLYNRNERREVRRTRERMNEEGKRTDLNKKEG